MLYRKIYFKILSLYIKCIVSYRLDFVFQLIGGFLLQFTGIFYVIVLFNNIADINGWSVYHLMLFYSLTVFAKAFADIFLSGAWALPKKIQMGEMDIMILRPVPLIVQLMPIITSSQGLSNIVGGLIMLIFSLLKLKIDLGFTDLIIIVEAIVFGGIIHASINFIGACLSFWTNGIVSSALTMFARSFCEFNKFPLDIYPRFMQHMLTVIIPYGFISYFPSLTILDMKSSYTTMFIIPLVSCCIATLAFVIWHVGLRKYESTGS